MLFEEIGLVFDSLFSWILDVFFGLYSDWKLSKIGILPDRTRKVKIKILIIKHIFFSII